MPPSPELGCQWTTGKILDLSWPMCVYNTSRDVHVSGSIVRTGSWEGHLVSLMVNTMRGFGRDCSLLDIGGNIGFYTLAAARAGFGVDVFEPDKKKRCRTK